MKYPVEILTREEAITLLQACNTRYAAGTRNRALVAVMYRGGLRVSEALALYPKDIDAAGTIRVLHGKGDKARTVAMDPAAFGVLKAWMDFREKLNIPADAPVFCTYSEGNVGKPIATAYVRNLFKRLAYRAGIKKRVHAHALRHAFATEMRQEGIEIGVISAALGHASIATTHTYLKNVAPKAVIEAIQARTWNPTA